MIFVARGYYISEGERTTEKPIRLYYFKSNSHFDIVSSQEQEEKRLKGASKTIRFEVLEVCQVDELTLLETLRKLNNQHGL